MSRLSELKREYDEHNYFISFEEYCYKSGVEDGFNECRNNGYETAFANGMKKGRADERAKAINEFMKFIKIELPNWINDSEEIIARIEEMADFLKPKIWRNTLNPQIWLRNSGTLINNLMHIEN